MKKILKWWKGRTLNEKLMYWLLVLFTIGIVVRWDFITQSVTTSVKNMYSVELPDTLEVK